MLGVWLSGDQKMPYILRSAMPFTPCKSALAAHFERVRPPLKQGANANLKHENTMIEDKSEVSSDSANVKPKRKRKPFKDFTNTRLGRLLIVSEAEPDKWKNMQWFCRCDCGKYIVVAGSSIRRGATKSCGCWNKESSTTRATKHGLHSHALYGTWKNMVQRCYNPANSHFDSYGGRGIVMCDRWRESFANFLEDMGEKPSPAHSIERRNNNEGYCKENCSWELIEVQANNKSNNRVFEFNGKRQTLAQWARDVGITRRTLALRIDRLGWSPQRAFTTRSQQDHPV